jgi:hypothetical protein
LHDLVSHNLQAICAYLPSASNVSKLLLLLDLENQDQRDLNSRRRVELERKKNKSLGNLEKCSVWKQVDFFILENRLEKINVKKF